MLIEKSQTTGQKMRMGGGSMIMFKRDLENECINDLAEKQSADHFKQLNYLEDVNYFSRQNKQPLFMNKRASDLSK